jgi:hypothetical protein
MTVRWQLANLPPRRRPVWMSRNKGYDV